MNWRRVRATRWLLGAEIMAACLLLPATTRCGSQHLLEPDSIEAFHNVASPYLFVGCREITVAPVYTLDLQSGQPRSSGGVMFGGCGRLAEIKCAKGTDGQPLSCEALKEWDQVLPDQPVSTPDQPVAPAQPAQPGGQ